MMGNYHVRFGGQGMPDALTPTNVFHWCFRLLVVCACFSHCASAHCGLVVVVSRGCLVKVWSSAYCWISASRISPGPNVSHPVSNTV